MTSARNLSADPDDEVVRSFFTLVPIPVSLSDLTTGAIVDVNAALCEITGFSRDQLIGRTSLEVGLSSDQLRERYVEALHRQGEIRGLSLEIPTRDGQRLRALMYARRILHRGTPHILATFMQVHSPREISNAEPASQLEEIRQLVATTTHDVNNLLTAVAGHAELLKTAMDTDAPGYRDASTIVRAVEMASELTRELLDLARAPRSEPERVDLHLLMGEVITTLAPTFPRGVSLDVALHAAEPRVIGTRSRLRRALVNLVVNARDAIGEAGNLRLATHSRHLDETDGVDFEIEPGDYILMQVADDGPGIPAADLDRVFDRFFTTKGTRGTGLGLGIVSEVIRSHGGDIRVTSEPGAGTTFELVLPTLR